MTIIAMIYRRFHYLADPLFIFAVVWYLTNRFVIKPYLSSPGDFFHCYLNDVLCLPIWLPPTLWMHRRLRIRRHDCPPTLVEVCFHWAIWSVYFEVIAPGFPQFYPLATRDWWDIAAYAIGGLFAWLWWNHRGWRFSFPSVAFKPIN